MKNLKIENNKFDSLSDSCTSTSSSDVECFEEITVVCDVHPAPTLLDQKENEELIKSN